MSFYVPYMNEDDWKRIKTADAPTFRFSNYFLETRKRCRTKRAGLWLKKLDNDTIEDMMGILKKVDAELDAGHKDLVEGSELWKDYIDLFNLSVLLWEWETNQKVNREPDADETQKQIEYLFRLANLVQFDYNQRHEIKHSVLDADNKKYKGKLAIYE